MKVLSSESIQGDHIPLAQREAEQPAGLTSLPGKRVFSLGEDACTGCDVDGYVSHTVARVCSSSMATHTVTVHSVRMIGISTRGGP